MPQQQAGNNILQMILGLAQMKAQREELAQRAVQNDRATKLSWLQTALPIAKASIDPGQLTSLAQQGEELGVGDKTQLLHILSNIQPDQEVIRAYRARMGLARADEPTGAAISANAADMVTSGQPSGARIGSDFIGSLYSADTPEAEIFRTRTATGMTPGALTADTAIAGLPAEFFRKERRIAAGELPSVGQTMSHQLGMGNLNLGWAGNRLGWETLAQQGALAEAGLGVDRMRISAGAAAESTKGLNDLLNVQRQLLEGLTRDRVSLSSQDVISRLQTLRNLNAQIRAAGGSAPDFEPQEYLRNSYSPSAMQSFWNRALTAK